MENFDKNSFLEHIAKLLDHATDPIDIFLMEKEVSKVENLNDDEFLTYIAVKEQEEARCNSKRTLRIHRLEEASLYEEELSQELKDLIDEELAQLEYISDQDYENLLLDIQREEEEFERNLRLDEEQIRLQQRLDDYINALKNGSKKQWEAENNKHFDPIEFEKFQAAAEEKAKEQAKKQAEEKTKEKSKSGFENENDNYDDYEFNPDDYHIDTSYDVFNPLKTFGLNEFGEDYKLQNYSKANNALNRKISDDDYYRSVLEKTKDITTFDELSNLNDRSLSISRDFIKNEGKETSFNTDAFRASTNFFNSKESEISKAVLETIDSYSNSTTALEHVAKTKIIEHELLEKLKVIDPNSFKTAADIEHLRITIPNISSSDKNFTLRDRSVKELLQEENIGSLHVAFDSLEKNTKLTTDILTLAQAKLVYDEHFSNKKDSNPLNLTKNLDLTEISKLTTQNFDVTTKENFINDNSNVLNDLNKNLRSNILTQTQISEIHELKKDLKPAIEKEIRYARRIVNYQNQIKDIDSKQDYIKTFSRTTQEDRDSKYKSLSTQLVQANKDLQNSQNAETAQLTKDKIRQLKVQLSALETVNEGQSAIDRSAKAAEYQRARINAQLTQANALVYNKTGFFSNFQRELALVDKKPTFSQHAVEKLGLNANIDAKTSELLIQRGYSPKTSITYNRNFMKGEYLKLSYSKVFTVDEDGKKVKKRVEVPITHRGIEASSVVLSSFALGKHSALISGRRIGQLVGLAKDAAWQRKLNKFNDSELLSWAKQHNLSEVQLRKVVNAASQKYCQKCKTIVPADASVCPKCGSAALQGKDTIKYCQKCKTIIPAAASTCPKCGSAASALKLKPVKEILENQKKNEELGLAKNSNKSLQKAAIKERRREKWTVVDKNGKRHYKFRNVNDARNQWVSKKFQNTRIGSKISNSFQGVKNAFGAKGRGYIKGKAKQFFKWLGTFLASLVTNPVFLTIVAITLGVVYSVILFFHGENYDDYLRSKTFVDDEVIEETLFVSDAELYATAFSKLGNDISEVYNAPISVSDYGALLLTSFVDTATPADYKKWSDSVEALRLENTYNSNGGDYSSFLADRFKNAYGSNILDNMYQQAVSYFVKGYYVQPQYLNKSIIKDTEVEVKYSLVESRSRTFNCGNNHTSMDFGGSSDCNITGTDNKNWNTRDSLQKDVNESISLQANDVNNALSLLHDKNQKTNGVVNPVKYILNDRILDKSDKFEGLRVNVIKGNNVLSYDQHDQSSPYLLLNYSVNNKNSNSLNNNQSKNSKTNTSCSPYKIYDDSAYQDCLKGNTTVTQSAYGAASSAPKVCKYEDYYIGTRYNCTVSQSREYDFTYNLTVTSMNLDSQESIWTDRESQAIDYTVDKMLPIEYIVQFLNINNELEDNTFEALFVNDKSYKEMKAAYNSAQSLQSEEIRDHSIVERYNSAYIQSMSAVKNAVDFDNNHLTSSINRLFKLLTNDNHVGFPKDDYEIHVDYSNRNAVLEGNKIAKFTWCADLASSAVEATEFAKYSYPLHVGNETAQTSKDIEEALGLILIKGGSSETNLKKIIHEFDTSNSYNRTIAKKYYPAPLEIDYRNFYKPLLSLINTSNFKENTNITVNDFYFVFENALFAHVTEMSNYGLSSIGNVPSWLKGVLTHEPAKNASITQPFGYQSWRKGKFSNDGIHRGIDVVGATTDGKVMLLAVTDADVIRKFDSTNICRDNSGYANPATRDCSTVGRTGTGNAVVIGFKVKLPVTLGGYETYVFVSYNHLDPESPIITTNKVKAGDNIGYGGNTGWSIGTHIHLTLSYYVDSNGKPMNTRDFNSSTMNGVNSAAGYTIEYVDPSGAFKKPLKR